MPKTTESTITPERYKAALRFCRQIQKQYRAGELSPSQIAFVEKVMPEGKNFWNSTQTIKAKGGY